MREQIKGKNYEEILDLIIGKIEKKEDKEKIVENKENIIKFFEIIDGIYKTRINEGLIDIRKNFDEDIVELDIGNMTSFWTKIWEIKKDGSIYINDVLYNKEDKEFIKKWIYWIDWKNIDLSNQEKIKLLIDWAEISTSLIPYVNNRLWTILEYDDGTFVTLSKDHFKNWIFISDHENEYEENTYVYSVIMDFEKTVDYNLNLLILFWIKWYIDYLNIYFWDDKIMESIIDALIKNIKDIVYISTHYDWTETNIWIGTQGANCFIDVNANNFNKYMEELLK